MNSRERLFAVLDGRPVDRVPIWLLFPYHKVGYYADVRENPCYRDIFEHSKARALMLDRRHLGAPLFEPSVVSREEKTTGPGGVVVRRTLTWNGRTAYSETREQPDGGRSVKHLLDNEDDLCTVAEFPILTDKKAITAALDQHLPAYQREKAEFPAEYGAMMLDLGEPIGAVYGSANLLEYPIWSITQAETVRGYLDRLLERLRIIYRYALEHDLADVYFLVGSELASPPMVSRATFQSWIVPYARELIDLIHSYGRKVIQHYHGQIKEVLPDFLTMAPDGLHTIEAPPTGNCTLAEAFGTTGNRITLIGNIQYDCFRSYTEDEMRQAVKAVIDEANGRRFILSPSAGPYEPTISDRVRANYVAFLNAGWEHGGAA
ncbi:MAG: hypothetical protein A3K19_10570 [Lentisphaerae bacterium RIFOXYB12_FULL_65_16]|nr:MAG: hypothetical protein A3K18_05230 [Lentisphaerae bacterium RIFOXYA12_64_32]OGV87896.1 MAG: hypothetical protein A3K19_10570 [Lentisphaerae bacterium RIFOXYB12_FULL_65_16]